MFDLLPIHLHHLLSTYLNWPLSCMQNQNTYSRQHGDTRGKEIFETHPVILGGSPTDAANKAILTREEHIEAVRYWNKMIKELRNKRGG